MSSVIQGNYDTHPTRKVADIDVGFSGASSYFTNKGDDVTDGPTDGRTGLISLIVDADGARRRISTIGTSGDYNHIRGLAIWRRNFEVNFFARFKLVDFTSCRMFIGLTDSDPATMVASATLPTANYCGLWKDEGDTNFKFVRNDNSGGAVETSDVALNTLVHDFHMWLKRSGGADVIIFQLDNGDRLITSNNMPGAAVSMAFNAVIKTTANSIRQLDIEKIHLDALY